MRFRGRDWVLGSEMAELQGCHSGCRGKIVSTFMLDMKTSSSSIRLGMYLWSATQLPKAAKPY